MNGKGRIITADIEAVGLLWDIGKDRRDHIHIIHCKDWESGELFTFFDDYEDRIGHEWLDEYEQGFKAGTIAEGINFLETCDVLLMHNIAGYDAHAIEKTFGGFRRNHFEARGKDAKYSDIMPYKTMDTAVLSRTLNPERKLPGQAYTMGIKLPGPHTIESHGIRMGRHKPEHEDWSHLSIDMIHRCREDVEIGEDMMLSLLIPEFETHLKRPNKVTGLDIRNAYYCELRLAFTVARQEQRGFAVDVAYMNGLIIEMDEELERVERAFRPLMPQRLKMKKLSDAQVEKNTDMLHACEESTYACCLQYQQAMEKCGNRASYAATYWKILTAKGAYLKNVTKYIPAARGHAQEYGDNPPVHGPFTPLVWEDIPLGNRDAVKQLLYKHGWLGVNYNDTELEYIEDNEGELPHPWSGKIDQDSIDRWEESGHVIPDWAKGIVEWYVIQSRRTQILNKKDVLYFKKNQAWPKQASGNNECRGLLAKARCFDEGSDIEGMTGAQYYAATGLWPTSGHWRVPAQAFSCATNTFRMRHKTVVNIPSRGLYGKEMRKIFIAGPGKLVIGADGSGLELRMLAHFMNDPEYQEVILSGDIHTHNQNLAGLSKRDFAKTFIYAFLYGSGIPNLARQLGLSFHVVEAAVKRFKKELPKLTNLLERVEAAGKQFGYLLAVDGRRGRIRTRGKSLALHTALNVLLQMTGSLVMKYAHIFAEDNCVEEGLIDCIEDFPIVVHMHDEFQGEVPKHEVMVCQYDIPAADWKAEEKRQHTDEIGRLWSAPKVLEPVEDDMLCCVRFYHPIGEQYCRALEQAGTFLKLRCPTAGEYMIGESWADTH